MFTTNVYLREIEEFLFTHPKTSDVQVIGLPDDKYGEIVMAWVSLREGQHISAEELQSKIAHFKIPAHFKFVEEFPMTVTSKIRKVEMRDISMKEMGINKSS